MIIADTNVIYALGDTSDTEHARCRAWLSRTDTEALLISPTVVAGACYLLDRRIGPHAEAAFLDGLGDGPYHTFKLVDLVTEDVRRMARPGPGVRRPQARRYRRIDHRDR